MAMNRNVPVFQNIRFESDPERDITSLQVSVFFGKQIETLAIAIRFHGHFFIVSTDFRNNVPIGKTVLSGYRHGHCGFVKAARQPVVVKIHPVIIPGVIFIFFFISGAVYVLPFHSDPVTVTYRRKRKPQWFRQDAARIRNGKDRCCFHRKAVLAIPCFQRP